MQEISGDITGLQVDQAKVATDTVIRVHDQVFQFQVGQRRFENPLPAAYPAMGAWAEDFIVTDDRELFLNQPEPVIQASGGHGQPCRHLSSRDQFRDPVHRQLAWRQKVEQALRLATLMTDHENSPLIVQPVLKTLHQGSEAAVMFGVVRPQISVAGDRNTVYRGFIFEPVNL